MSFYAIVLIVFSIFILSVSVPVVSSIENGNNGLSYTEKNCDNDSCVVTTCFENQPCIVNDSDDLPPKTTSSNNEIRQLFDGLDFDSNLNNMKLTDMFDGFIDLK
jgi:hypothetical protein